MKSLTTLLTRLKQSFRTISAIDEKLDDIKINQGIALSLMNERSSSKNIRDYEFKVFSQWGEDGILQHLTRTVDIRNKTFIEFGVGDFSESNCRFLLMKDNWHGFIIDSSAEYLGRLKKSYYFWKYQIEALDAFITKDNINELLAKSGFQEDLGILSVDLDGNDYYILAAIDTFRPRILICEYNAVFGPTRKISVPYRPDFYRTNAHYSNLYWGASLAAMTHIANLKGYQLVGTNRQNSNAFYVRTDLLDDRLQTLTAEAAYAPSTFRESRDKNGNSNFVSGEARIDIIKGLPVFDVEKAMIEPL